MLKTIRYDFPLPSAVNGAMLGNGATGVMIWGEDNILNITVGSGDLWDHRGGIELTDVQNFANIRKAAEAYDLPAMMKLFEAKKSGEQIMQATLVPVGRAVITMPESCELKYYELELETGILKIFYQANGAEKVLYLCADMSMNDVLSGKNLPDGSRIDIVSSYELSEKLNYSYSALQSPNLRVHGYQEPQTFSDGKTSGFIQEMPEDPSFALFCRRSDDTFTLKFMRDIHSADAAFSAAAGSYDFIENSSVKFFKEYWQDMPMITGLDEVIEKLYYHGLFKYGIMTNPAGVTPGLQGPWIEDDHFPPWSADYHFNINVQMCNLPGFKAGKFANLKILFDLVLSWKDKLRKNARCMAGIDNGYTLPHATDDRGICMGQFWAGCIDHGCAAWIAKMMFDYCEYTCDFDFLREEVYDFMSGVLQVYLQLTDKNSDGKLYFPVSVSPEYRAAAITAWGRNASFQLAAIRQLAQNMVKASKILGIPADKDALMVIEELPLYTLVDDEIALWEGLLPERSHRHHSHLAGIAPFDVIDPFGKETKDIVAKSYNSLVQKGMGEWSGWSMPWASQLHSRCGNGGAAALVLKIWVDCFCNAGGGSLHNAKYFGFTSIAPKEVEIMQMDGAMGAITAIQEMFLHVYDGELRVFWGAVPQKHDITFTGMYAPGKVRVSGIIDKKGKVTCEVYAEQGTDLKISVCRSETYTQKLSAGETVKLQLTGNKLERI